MTTLKKRQLCSQRNKRGLNLVSRTGHFNCSQRFKDHIQSLQATIRELEEQVEEYRTALDLCKSTLQSANEERDRLQADSLMLRDTVAELEATKGDLDEIVLERDALHEMMLARLDVENERDQVCCGCRILRRANLPL